MHSRWVGHRWLRDNRQRYIILYLGVYGKIHYCIPMNKQKDTSLYWGLQRDASLFLPIPRIPWREQTDTSSSRRLQRDVSLSQRENRKIHHHMAVYRTFSSLNLTLTGKGCLRPQFRTAKNVIHFRPLVISSRFCR